MTPYGVYDHTPPGDSPFLYVDVGHSNAARFAAETSGFLAAIARAAEHIPFPP